MKLIGVTITLLVLVCNNLQVTGQVDAYITPLEFNDEAKNEAVDVTADTEISDFSNSSMLKLKENMDRLDSMKKNPTIDGMDLFPVSEELKATIVSEDKREEPATHRARSSSELNERSSMRNTKPPPPSPPPVPVPEALQRNNPYNPYNTKPGIKSSPYDDSELYFKSRMPGVERFDVKAIYHGYLGKLNLKCHGKPYKGSIPASEIAAAVKLATQQVDKEVAIALANFKSGNVIKSNIISADGRHLITGKLPAELSDYVDQEEAQYLEYVSKYLQDKLCIRPVEVVEKLTQIPTNQLASKHLKCSRRNGYHSGPYPMNCGNSKYRNYDGFCNNRKNTFWGKSNVCHVRFLPPLYQDGIYLPRSRGADGSILPPPRTVSLALHATGEDATFYTPWHFTWGQYVIHDIISTPQSVPSHGSGVQCCNQPYNDDSKCMPIMLFKGDPQLKSRNCINFIRSAPCPLCSLGPRQQLNLATSFIDHSAMYGTDNKTTSSLRTFRGGQLAFNKDRFGAPILPDSKSPLTDQCSKPLLGADKICFRSGDARVNQQPFIQLLHTLFLRRHNQHAKGLAEVNPRAPDEIIFQEARRLTIAELQHITYYEYLPVILGPEMADYFNLIEKDTLFSDYEEDIDATTWNECAAAACRFGHSQVTSMIKLGATIKNLRTQFFDPELMHDGFSLGLVKALLDGKAAVIDPFLTPSLKNHLYSHAGKDVFGSDLAAFNIQRGRDHGIPPYVDYLKFCTGFTVRSWKDLDKFIPSGYIAKLQSIYRDYRDIDLFTGGLYERKSIDADLGPTFSCIVGIQFYHLKFGDRYFYSHQKEAGRFTPAQLREIKTKVTLASLLCLTEPRLQAVQEHAFLIPGLYNVMKSCDAIRQREAINYNLWRGTF